MKNLNTELIGSRLKFARKRLKLAQHEVASKCNVSTSTICRLERGSFEDVSLPIIESVARALFVNPAWLSGYDVPMALEETLDQKLARRIELLNDEGKEKVMEYIEILYKGGYTNNL